MAKRIKDEIMKSDIDDDNEMFPITCDVTCDVLSIDKLW